MDKAPPCCAAIGHEGCQSLPRLRPFSFPAGSSSGATCRRRPDSAPGWGGKKRPCWAGFLGTWLPRRGPSREGVSRPRAPRAPREGPGGTGGGGGTRGAQGGEVLSWGGVTETHAAEERKQILEPEAAGPAAFSSTKRGGEGGRGRNKNCAHFAEVWW